MFAGFCFVLRQPASSCFTSSSGCLERAVRSQSIDSIRSWSVRTLQPSIRQISAQKSRCSTVEALESGTSSIVATAWRQLLHQETLPQIASSCGDSSKPRPNSAFGLKVTVANPVRAAIGAFGNGSTIIKFVSLAYNSGEYPTWKLVRQQTLGSCIHLSSTFPCLWRCRQRVLRHPPRLA